MHLRWGIIGPGRIAGKFADAMTAVEDSIVSAVASRDADRAQAFASKFAIDGHLASYSELASLNTVDAVYIATPHRFHFEQAMMCLEAGKHVLCEKPITVNAHECRTLVEKAREKNLFLMEGLWTRFLPIYEVVRTWIDDDCIGLPNFLNSTFCFTITEKRPDRLWRHDLAGGALLDIGVYNIAVSQFIMQQDPVEISIRGHLTESNVDDQISALLTYRPPTTAAPPPVSQFTCSFLSQGPNDFNISGPTGTIRIHNDFWGATKATLRTTDKPVRTVEAPFIRNGFEYQIEAANQCIRRRENESPTMSHADSVGNMELMDEIRRRIGLKYEFE